MTRFYAGCYSKGELASLIDRLQELSKDADYSLTSHPRVLGAILLSDWVFSQHPKSVTEVVNLILDGLGLRFLLTSSSRRVQCSTPLALPAGCGKQELVDRCISLLHQQPPLDYALDVIDLLKANSSFTDILPVWLAETLAVRLIERTHWLEYGLQLGCLSNVPRAQLENILEDQPLTGERVDLLFRAKRLDFLESDEQRFSSTVQSILSGDTEATSGSRVQGVVDLLAHLLDVNRYAISFKLPQNAPLSDTWRQAEHQTFSELKKMNDSVPSFKDASKCYALLGVVQKEADKLASHWASELSSWDAVVEEARQLWGNQWALYTIANVASGIKSSTETCTDSPFPFDDSKSLCRRSRYARLRAGTSGWWPKHFQGARTNMQKLHVCLLWLTWASENTIMQSFQEFNSLVAGFTEDDWARLFDSVEHGLALTLTQSGDRQIELSMASLPESLSPRACVAIALRTRPTTQMELYSKYLTHYEGGDARILQFCQNIAVRRLNMGDEHWQDSLHVIQRCFAKGVISERFAYQQFVRRTQKNSIPLEHAIHIIKNADHYPTFLVAAAESKCRESVARKIVPVGRVAERDRWFET